MADPAGTAGADSGAGSKKGTGVFFGPAAAIWLSRSRAGPTRSKTLSLFGSGPPPREGNGKDNRTMPPGSSGNARPRRRASMAVLVSNSDCRGDLPSRAASFTAPHCFTSSPGALVGPAAHASHVSGASSLQFAPQLPPAPATMQGADSTAGAMPVWPHMLSAMTVTDNQQAQLQSILRSEQQRLQESQQLQAQLQQLLQLQQQQQEMQRPSLEPQFGNVNMDTSVNSTMLLGAAIPSWLAQQLQVLQQQPGQLLGSDVSGSQVADDASGSNTYANISGLLQQEAFVQSAPSLLAAYAAAPVPIEQGSAAAQQLQLQACLPQLQEEPDEEQAEVEALDGLINRCVLRLLQLRQQMSGKNTAAAASRCGGLVGNPAVPASEGYAAGQMPAVASPFFLLQQQTSSTLTAPPVATFSTASVTQQQQQQLLWDGGFVGRQSMDLGVAGMPCNTAASALAVRPSCNLAPSASGYVVSTPSPTPPPRVFLQLQAPGHMLSQQQPQLLLQQVAGQRFAETEQAMHARVSASDSAGGSSIAVNLPNTTFDQGMVLTQAGQQQATGHQELVGGWPAHLQELQELQQLLASQLGSMSLQ